MMQTKDVQENGGSSFKECWNIAVWKLQNFSVIRVLREIKFGQNWVSKSAILVNLVALNFDFLLILHFSKAKMYQINKFRAQIARATIWNF